MDGLSTAASGLSAARAGLSVWANDLANAQSAGFVAERPLVQEGPVQPLPNHAGTVGSGAVLAQVGRWVSGSIVQTGNPLDLALTGGEFFAVALPGGSVGLTRDGAFHWSPDGRLVSPGGLPVLDSAGRPVVLPKGADPAQASVDPNGQVLVADKATGQVLGIAAPASLNAGGVQGGPDGTLVAAGKVTLAPVPSGGLMVGALDGSGVSLTSAVVGLMQAVRAYEASAKALDAQGAGLKIIASL